MTLLQTLQARFEAHPERHPGLAWQTVAARLDAQPGVLSALAWMEQTGGEPDVLGLPQLEELLYCDCSKETPAGRRSLCYDEAALKKRAKNPPADSAVRQAQEQGIALMSRAQYDALQTVGEFDCKTSSWISTPESVRSLGGALFCERRYGMVFTFHNGADSYYSVRGWRGVLRL